MDLRFQKEDDVDRAVKQRHSGRLLTLLVVCGVIDGLSTCFGGESFVSYKAHLLWIIGFGFVYWMAGAFYSEFRLRTKEIDGKVSAIEVALIASKPDHTADVEKAVTLSRIEWTVNDTRKDLAGLLERLTALEEKLTGIGDSRRI